MRLLLMTVLAASIFCSCNNEVKTGETATTKQTTQPTNQNDLEIGCYGFTDGKNTVMLDVTDNKEQVKGNLSYALAEKDKNEGTFTGSVNYNILMATYTFQSEGKTSTRMVAFKIEGNKLMEGHGEMSVDGVNFVNVNNLSYSSNMPLEKGKCSK